MSAVDIRPVNSEGDPKSAAKASPAPRSGLKLMALILVAMALLSIYSNVQKARVKSIEVVTINPPSPLQSSPSVSPTPAVP